MRVSAAGIFTILSLSVVPVQAQEVPPAAAAAGRLTLPEAIARTLETHPALRAAREGQRIAAAGVDQARAAWFPRVDYVESWQRSNQPVFVFGSLLAQSRFGPGNFAIDALNHPEAVTNLRGSVTLQQNVFDPARQARVSAARAGRESAALAVTSLGRDLALQTARAYGRVLVAQAGQRTAEAAVKAAQEDQARAERRRDAGLATDVDVLAFQVHASAMQARLAQAMGEESVARATLNDLIGAPLDSVFALEALAPAGSSPAEAPLPELEREALDRREQSRQAALQEQVASANRTVARAAFLPTVGFQAGYEFDGKGWTGRERWWAAGLEVRWNLFSGLADRARLVAAEAAVGQARAERERVNNGIRLDVRSAVAQLTAARLRAETSRSAVAQAQEAQRIIRERYEAGMAGVSDLLRAANARLEAEQQQTAATVDLLVSEQTLAWALGR